MIGSSLGELTVPVLLAIESGDHARPAQQGDDRQHGEALEAAVKLA
jgi:hypothetical protein